MRGRSTTAASTHTSSTPPRPDRRDAADLHARELPCLVRRCERRLAGFESLAHDAVDVESGGGERHAHDVATWFALADHHDGVRRVVRGEAVVLAERGGVGQGRVARHPFERRHRRRRTRPGSVARSAAPRRCCHVRTDCSATYGRPVILELRRLAGDALREPVLAAKQPFLDEMVAIAGGREGAPAVAGAAVEVIDASTVAVQPGVELVAPRDLKRRTWGTVAGRVATLHTLAHIEANTVNLALDAVHRFDGMPLDFYVDWTGVAAEELGHFLALGERLGAHDAAYGDLACHGGLWDIAVRTAHDVGARMALVPLVFEARGLDVTPGLIERFERHGDVESADVLRVVLADEIGHVEVGRRWYEHVCALRSIEPRAEFERLVDEYSLLVVPPFNTEARVAAGFSTDELDRWEQRFRAGR